VVKLNPEGVKLARITKVYTENNYTMEYMVSFDKNGVIACNGTYVHNFYASSNDNAKEYIKSYCINRKKKLIRKYNKYSSYSNIEVKLMDFYRI